MPQKAMSSDSHTYLQLLLRRQSDTRLANRTILHGRAASSSQLAAFSSSSGCNWTRF